MHSLIVPIQLFPTSQRDIPGSPRRKNTREDGGRTAIRWGGGEKKRRGRKGLWPLQIVSPCFSFFQGEGNWKKNIQRGKLK